MRWGPGRREDNRIPETQARLESDNGPPTRQRYTDPRAPTSFLRYQMPPLTADSERVGAWLSTVRFCKSLDSEQLAAIANEIRVRPFVAGQTLASAGDEVTEFWMLVEGELDTFLTDPRGREKWLGTIRQGET